MHNYSNKRWVAHSIQIILIILVTGVSCAPNNLAKSYLPPPAPEVETAAAAPACELVTEQVEQLVEEQVCDMVPMEQCDTGQVNVKFGSVIRNQPVFITNISSY